MKFWAKIRINREEDASNLILAFFQEFNPVSSIEIKGKEVKVEIVFEGNPPMETIKVIKQCDIIEFYFGRTLGDCPENEIEQSTVVEAEDFEQTNQVATEEEVPQENEENQKKGRRAPIKEAKITRIFNVETVDVPLLDEIAEKATSFEHFAKLLAEWFENEKHQKFFENLVLVAKEVEHLSWPVLEKALKEKGISCNQWDKIRTGQRISEKLNHSITTLPLLKAIRQFKDYSFKKEESEEQISTEKETSLKETEVKNRVKMECMPEIPHFEEILGSVDKTQPIEDRIRYVLNSMGLEKLDTQEQYQIFEVANIAIKEKEICFENIYSKSSIPKERAVESRLTFSKFINDFVNEYDPEKKVKLVDFLIELQKNVLQECEIKSFRLSDI